MGDSVIISFLGSVGAGKSSTIKSFLKVLDENKIKFNFFGIDETRKKIWEQRGKGQWTWDDEDDAYSEIFSEISKINDSLIILETTGLAKRMQRAHRLLAQTNKLLTVKIACDAETCAKRHATRDKNMSEYPVLPLLNSIEEGIFLASEDLQMLKADLILDSFKNTIEQNTKLLWKWYKEIKVDKFKDEETKNHVSIYLKNYKHKSIDINYKTDLFDLVKIIAAQNKNIKFLACARDLILNPDTKKLELEAFNTNEIELQETLNNCFENNLRIVKRRKTSFLIKTNLGEELKINCAARDLFLGGASYKTVEELAAEVDFTINAVFIDPINEKIVDPLNAIEDLRNLTLRSPDLSRYEKHPKTLIDIYHAVHLAGRYGFRLEEKLKTFFREKINVGSLLSISAFFTADELTQLFNAPRCPSLGLELMRELGLLKLDLPEIYQIYREEAQNKNQNWTNTLLRIDNQKQKNYSLFFACLLADISNLDIEKTEQILSIFQPNERTIANLNVCLIQRKKLFELKKFTENTKPAVKPVKTQLRLQPKPQTTIDEIREPVQKFFASFWPLTLDEFLNFLELTEAKRFADLKNFIEDLLKRYKIDPDYRTNLITKKMLLDRFKNLKGETISVLLEEIDKKRLRLLTPERALNYLEENFSRLIN